MQAGGSQGPAAEVAEAGHARLLLCVITARAENSLERKGLISLYSLQFSTKGKTEQELETGTWRQERTRSHEGTLLTVFVSHGSLGLLS